MLKNPDIEIMKSLNSFESLIFYNPRFSNIENNIRSFEVKKIKGKFFERFNRDKKIDF